MTIFDTIKEFILRWIYRMDIGLIRFIVQASLFALCPTVICGIAYLRNLRLAPVQVSLCVISSVAVFFIPVDRLFIYDPMARLWLITACLLVLTFLPPLLGFLLASNQQDSQKVTQCIYSLILILSVLQLFKRSF